MDRWTWKCRTARLKIRWKVGTARAPMAAARVAENSSHRKSESSAPPAPCARLSSIRLPRNGPWNEFEAREIRIRTLNSAKETAIRRVLTPAIRAA